MWTYQYKNGDRPLEGYTIQRAAGRGGFGEVYYAVSDAGREVALKAVTGYEQIELRGISQCMNLKSAQLVTISAHVSQSSVRLAIISLGSPGFAPRFSLHPFRPYASTTSHPLETHQSPTPRRAPVRP